MNVFQDPATIAVTISVAIMLICIVTAIVVGAVALYRSRPLDERTKPLFAKAFMIAFVPSVVVWILAYLLGGEVFLLREASEFAHVVSYTAVPAIITSFSCVAGIVTLRTTNKE